MLQRAGFEKIDYTCIKECSSQFKEEETSSSTNIESITHFLEDIDESFLEMLLRKINVSGIRASIRILELELSLDEMYSNQKIGIVMIAAPIRNL